MNQLAETRAQPSFAVLLRTIWRHRFVVIATFLIVSALFFAYAWSATPVYRAEALVAPNKARASAAGGLAQLAGQFGGLAAMAGVDLNAGDTDKDVAIALLSADYFLADFIEREKLLPMLFADRWDGEKWKATWLASEPPTTEDAIDLFRKKILSVTEDRRTGLIRLNVEWRDRVKSAEWANKLIASVNEEMRARAMSEAQKNQEYLRERLKGTDMLELTQAIYRLLEVELKNEMLASVSNEYAFKVVDAASAPQAKDFVRPRRVLLSIFGIIVGIVLGLAMALVFNAVRDVRMFGGLRHAG